ncbi:hypothetical protein HBB16_13665 [Pseudonocardia sp. MCCB 268]|nr:hypothetical protein [Pseudonocardia cytotoxica]
MLRKPRRRDGTNSLHQRDINNHKSSGPQGRRRSAKSRNSNHQLIRDEREGAGREGEGQNSGNEHGPSAGWITGECATPSS